MAERDKKEGKLQLSRRDFLKTGAAATALGAAGLESAVTPVVAGAALTPVTTYHTTCPYCSASCGQLVDVDGSGNVVDIYGDFRSPLNDAGLCAKGAGAYQLVTNKRRIGAFAGSHPVNNTFAYDATYTDGIAYKKIGNGAWSKMALKAALDEAAAAMVTARGTVNAANGFNSKSVAFFGSSHINNEANYMYRRMIAQFGTSNTEHQARI